MRIRRLDDYQSWSLEVGRQTLFIDPWLTTELSLPLGHWFFGRRRASAPTVDAPKVDALVLTAHFSDHLHPRTLERFSRTTPVFASPTAARAMRRLGFTEVTTLRRKEPVTVWPGLQLTPIAPGFPYAHNSLGLVFEAEGRRAYLETHMVPLPRARDEVGAVELLVAPMQSVRVMGVPFVQSPERSVDVARVLSPKVWLPTGVDPQLAHGLFQSLGISTRGTLEQFQQLLQSSGLTTALVTPAIGEAVEV